jgi:hypothetical protein
MNKPALIVAVVLLAAIAGGVAWREDAIARVQAAAGRGPAPAPTGSAEQGRQWLGALPESAEPQQSELPRVPLPPVDSSAPAWISMADARENGDARTPPIQRDVETHNAPTAAELADPQAYQQYENNQHARLLGNFVAAAATELPKLQADLERGRAAGIPQEQLAKVEEKIARIKGLSDGIVKDQPQLRASAGR